MTVDRMLIVYVWGHSLAWSNDHKIGRAQGNSHLDITFQESIHSLNY